jgi:hypothetical protein
MGVDAFIVQDLGLASLLHSLLPDITLHASTQMGIHNLEGVEALLPFGFKRVVLARETPLAEVARVRAHTDIELEYFVQGALCVSFSGNCYLSERLLDASGNRGKCKQLCRLPYTLSRNGVALKHGYLLSAKDFNMIDRLPQLAHAGVDVLKIEGRARRPSYVAMTTREYRRALDGARPDGDMLALAFNRLYTPGYLDGNGDVISPYNNHIGIAVGKVLRVSHGKRFDEVWFSADRDIAPRSALKFFVDGIEQSTVSAFDLSRDGDSYRLTTTQKVPVGAEVRLISEARREAEALGVTRRVHLPLRLSVEADKPLTARFCSDGQWYLFEGVAPAAAVNQPLTEQQFRANLDKSEYFALDVTFDVFEPVFMPVRQLNEWRRQLMAYIFDIRTARYKRVAPHCAIDAFPAPEPLWVAVTERADRLPEARVIVYSPEQYRVGDVAAFVASCREVGAKPYLDAPNFALQEDIDLLRQIVAETGVGVVANNYYALCLTADTLAGSLLNVSNGAAANALGLPLADCGTPYMTLRHCPMRCLMGADCAHCPYGEGYTYTMDNGKVLRLRRKRLSTCTFYLE